MQQCATGQAGGGINEAAAGEKEPGLLQVRMLAVEITRFYYGIWLAGQTSPPYQHSVVVSDAVP